MRVVHINTVDRAGGAARSAYRLHQGLLRLGCDSSMFVRVSRGKDRTVKVYSAPKDVISRVRRRLRLEVIKRDFRQYRNSRPAHHEPFCDSRSENGRDLEPQLPQCDIVNLHWIADSFVDYEAFFAAVPQQTPIVWTLHDMSAFTGGCHYGMGCTRYVGSCGACPQLGSTRATDLSFRVWERKKKAFSQVPDGRLHFVTPSEWLANELRRSSLGGSFPVSVIPYGLDLHDFSPRNRSQAREILGLSQSAKIVLFVADGLDNSRKGFALLVEAVRGLEEVQEVALLSLGRARPSLDLRIPWTHLETINNDRLLSLVYSAADLFVIPSLEDNLPNTVMEAIACGTPVVGFDVGGIPEMVRPGRTGALAPAGNVPELRDAIVQLLQNPARLAEMAARCRQLAEEEYSLELQATRYDDLYRRILRGN